MKYKLPDSCAGVSHAGESIPVADDGTIDITEAVAEHLMSHGISAAEVETEALPQDGVKPGKRTAR